MFASETTLTVTSKIQGFPSLKRWAQKIVCFRAVSQNILGYFRISIFILGFIYKWKTELRLNLYPLCANVHC